MDNLEGWTDSFSKVVSGINDLLLQFAKNQELLCQRVTGMGDGLQQGIADLGTDWEGVWPAMLEEMRKMHETFGKHIKAQQLLNELMCSNLAELHKKVNAKAGKGKHGRTK